MLRPPDSFKTTRLTLRRLEPQDDELIFAAYAQDPEVTKYLTWRPHRTVADTKAFVEGRINAWDAGTEFVWTILLNGSRLIGGIALRLQDCKADVGYVIARPHWGHGYAPEALGALVQWALAQPAIHRVWAVCDIDNPKSARVMEKVGMIREGILRRWVFHPQAGSEPRDCLCYSIIKEGCTGPADGG